MSENELIALLRLQKIPNIGDVKAKKLIEHCGSAAKVFKERPAALLGIEGIGTRTLACLHETSWLHAAFKELEFIKKAEIECLGFQKGAYPKGLKHCADGPILLFRKGNIDLVGRRIISVVGTRNITAYGRSFCEAFIEEVAPLEPVIVSGLAFGVDIAIQRAAMAQGLQTLSCFAHGLNRIYPKQHSGYAQRMCRHGGLLTEFWSSDLPEREHFLKRNRIIAGISEATVEVESAEKGGSLVTANLAHGYHRNVFAVPGRSTDTFSVGCNNLLKQQKAHVLTSAADLIYILGWKLADNKNISPQRTLFPELTETEQSIYSYLQFNGKQLLDNVAFGCSLPIFEVAATLLDLEMKGMVRPWPGKLFEIVS